ncbi:MAG: hypothetical protein SPE81_06055 [Agathobacter sp.]|nr:hypothetical protein [Agathobacter sp.]
MKDGIHPEYCDKCGFIKEQCECQKPMTNADRIRSMTDEELAEIIVGLSAHCLAGIGACDCSAVKTQPCYEVCGEITRKWLQSEVEE